MSRTDNLLDAAVVGTLLFFIMFLIFALIATITAVLYPINPIAPVIAFSVWLLAIAIAWWHNR